jgi:DNA-directed RNA polymerase specialized sigma24 family protein
VDTDALLRAHDATIRKWAGLAARRHPITRDEAYGELLLGFAQGLSTWKPDGGKALIGHCRDRAFWAVKDYCRSLSFTPPRAKLGAKVERGHELAERRSTASPPTLDGVESVEFWQRVHSCLYRRHRRAWLVLNLIHREGWPLERAARYLGVSPSAVSQSYKHARAVIARSWMISKWLRGERWNRRQRPRLNPAPVGFEIPRGPRFRCCMAGCGKPVHARGKCWNHYDRDRRARRPAEARCRDD